MSLFKFLPRGTKVQVGRWLSRSGKGLSYGSFTGILLEGIRIGGWDVVDVEKSSGEIVSVYAFSLSKAE